MENLNKNMEYLSAGIPEGFSGNPDTGLQNPRKEIIILKEDKSLGSELAMNALDDIPQAKSDAKDIVGLVKSSGRVTGYQLSDGSAVSKEDGVAMAKKGDIRGVGIAHRKDSEYLKTLPDGQEGNNLSNLPSISEGRADLS